MLFDQQEAEIMAGAAQAPLRSSYPEAVFTNIFRDFFAQKLVYSQQILELGPGQYDLVRMLLASGATVVSLDHDPSVISLGRKRGYSTIFSDFRTFDWRSLEGRFDGVFCRASISPEWFDKPEAYGDLVDCICSVLKSDGRGWIAPWHGSFMKREASYVRRMLEAQREAFERNGFAMMELSPDKARRYLRTPRVDYMDPPLLFLRRLRMI
jgi:hypothetical protein